MSGFNKENCAMLDILEDAFCIYKKIEKLFKQNLKWNTDDEGVRDAISEIMTDFNTFLRNNAALFSETGEAVKFGCKRVQNIVGNCFTDNHQALHRMRDFEKFLPMIEVNVYIVQNLKQVQNLERLDGVFDKLDSRVLTLAQDAKSAILRNDPSDADVKVANINELIIYANLNAIGCRLHAHEIVAERRRYPNIANGYVNLPVHHCLTCDKVFIGEQTYNVYQTVFFLPEKKALPDLSDTGDDLFSDGLEEQSFLSEYGYTVRKGVLTEQQRHTILINVLSDGYSYFEVCRTIETAINLHMNNANCADAVKKWRSDLKFIGDYVKENPALLN